MASVADGVVYVVEVAPTMSVQVAPGSVRSRCHWTAGMGLPDAAALKLAVCPSVTVWFEGWVVTDGTDKAAGATAMV